ncbi:hypothetical protein SaSA20_0048a [Streptococcus agalactiae]|nr:hypothetical protein SaSA20_0048a [Streptococcus agalactiae]EAO75077.1 hypothetical protein SAN_0069 [Streptococcus agalactiae COH1]
MIKKCFLIVLLVLLSNLGSFDLFLGMGWWNMG